MARFGEIDRAALDRWITGNWGEDQFKDEEHRDEGACCECQSTAHKCDECPTFDGPVEALEDDCD